VVKTNKFVLRCQ